MKLPLAVLLAGSLFAFAGKPVRNPPSYAWQIEYAGGNLHYVAYSAETTGALARYAFPQYDGKTYTVAGFCGTTTQPGVLVDLRGKTITLTAHLETTGTPDFFFGGQLGGWNTGPLPPNFRLFISKPKVAFNLDSSQLDDSHYWWSQDAWVSLDAMLADGTIPTYTNGTAILGMTNGVVTMRLPINGSAWGGPNGKVNTDPSVAAGFLDTIAAPGKVGVFDGGGSFADVGDYLYGGMGTAVFVLDTFAVTP